MKTGEEVDGVIPRDNTRQLQLPEMEEGVDGVVDLAGNRLHDRQWCSEGLG